MFLEKKTLHKIWLNPGLKLTAPFEQSVFIWYGTGKISGAPNVNFRKISQCSEDDLRSRIFGTVVKFLPCLSLLGFSNISKWYNYPFLTDFFPKKVT